MPSLRFRRSVSALILLGALLPLSDLNAAPARDRSPRKPSTLQLLERQLSSFWGGIASMWEKMGPRIDDNGFLLQTEDEHSDSSREDKFPPKPLF
jgi:hypothetical protein